MKSSRQKLLGVLIHSPSRYSQKISCSSSRMGGNNRFVVKSQMATESLPVANDRMLVFVPQHPSIKHWVSVLRDKQTPCAIFRNAMAELGRLLIYEASRDWLISAVAAPPALQKLSEKFPGLHVYIGIIDPTVNDKGFIIPGLGDAGDGSFGT